MRSTASTEEERKRAVRAALTAADDKLDRLAESDSMLRAKSMAQMGMPPKVPEVPQVDGALTVAPAALGIFALGLYLLNGFGFFGDGGGSLDTLAEQMTAKFGG